MVTAGRSPALAHLRALASQANRRVALLWCYDRSIGRQVLAVVNFAPRKMGPEVSEVLVLGVPNDNGETVYVTPQQEVAPGVALF